MYQDAEAKHSLLLSVTAKRPRARVPVLAQHGSGRLHRRLGLAQLKRQLADAVAAVDNDVLMEQRDAGLGVGHVALTALERDLAWAFRP